MNTLTITKPKAPETAIHDLGNRQEELNEFIGFMLFFYLVPVLLMYFELLPFGSHNAIIPLMGLLISAYVLEKEVGGMKLGFRKYNLKRGMIGSVFFSIIFVAAMVILNKMGILAGNGYGRETILFYAYYILFSAPIQEFIFRSVMAYEFDLLLGRGKEIFKIALTAFVFSLAHSFYHSLTVLLGTFILGLFWGFLYMKYKNFWAIALSHAVIGVAAIFLGIV